MAVDSETTAEVEPADASEPEQARPRSWRSALLHELRSRPFGYTVLALFLIAGPIVSAFLFPQAPPAVAIVGGLIFGVYAALCAVPQKFI